MPAAGYTGHNTNYWANKLGINITKDKLAAQLVAEEGEPEAELEVADFRRDEIVELCRISLNFLAALAVPEMFKFNFPPVLLAAWQLLTRSAEDLINLFPQIALGIPRGHAKTTLIKLYIVYCILFTKKKFVLVIGSTAANAENILADIKDMLSELNVIKVFGDWRLGLEIDRQDLKKFGFRGRNITLAAIGAEGSIRGLNLRNQRPDVMIFEDVQTKECSESKLQSDALERWMIGTAMKAKAPSGCIFIFVGNMYPGTNSILKKLKSNSTWIKFISGGILADGTALWEELRSLKSLVEELDNDMAMGHPEIFFSEVLNDTEAGINTRTDLSTLKPWKWTENDRPQGKCIIIDPSANKKGGDEVSIGYFEVYDEVPALREILEENLSPGNTIRKSLLMALRTGTRLIIAEATGYQYSLLYWFEQICEQLGITGIQIVDIYSGSYSKNSRISDMLKSLSTGDIILHDSVRAIVTHQIANWNPLKRDNTDGILDLLAYAPKAVEMYGADMLPADSMLLMGYNEAKVQEFNSCF